MSPISTDPETDAVSQAISRAALMSGAKAIPLVSTAYEINIIGGLADVIAVRTFRNDEAESIEATLTFPLHVHAVLYSLEARIGNRHVKAVARSKSAAQEVYRRALDTGKTAVLREELLKGVHLLSVGHIAPAAEIAVTVRFAVALARVGDRIFFHLRLLQSLVALDPTSGEKPSGSVAMADKENPAILVEDDSLHSHRHPVRSAFEAAFHSLV